MPRFVSNAQTKVIRAPWWGEKETCTIRKFNYGDRQYFAGQTVNAEQEITPGEKAGKSITAHFNLERTNLAILERGIVSWTDSEGNGVPVTNEAIGALEERDADFILGEINDLNPSRQRSAEEEEAFPGADGSGAEE